MLENLKSQDQGKKSTAAGILYAALLTEEQGEEQVQTYIEKIAKQNFGLVRPGEEVIILAKFTDQTPIMGNEERADLLSKGYYDKLSNPQKWFFFFFDRERFAM